MPVIMTPKSPVFVPEYGVPPPGAIPQPGGGWVMPGATPGVTPPAPPAAPPAAPPVSAPLPTPAIPPPKPPPPPLESLVAAASTAGGKTGVLPGGAPAWTSFIPEAKVDRRGNVTNLGFRKDIILEKLRKANAPEETISDFILKNHDVREASLGDNIIVDGLDSRGSLKAIVVDKREYAKTEDIASPDKKLDAYIKLGILPEGTKLIGDGSAAAVKGFNKTYKTDVSADFPYALPNLVSNVEMSHKEQLAFEKETLAFEKSLKDAPLYLQQAYEKGGIEGYNKAVTEYNATVERWNDSSKASLEKKIGEAPQELQDAYKQGGVQGYNDAVEVYAQKVAGYNLAAGYFTEATAKEYKDALNAVKPYLSWDIIKTAAKTPGSTDQFTQERQLNLLAGTESFDMIKYLKDGKNPNTLLTLGISQQQIKDAKDYISAEKGVTGYTVDYFKERGWDTSLPGMRDLSKTPTDAELNEYQARINEANKKYYEVVGEGRKPGNIIKEMALSMVPIYGTIRYAKKGGSTGWIVASAVFDLLTIVPIVGQLSAAARGTYLAGSAGKYLTVGVRAGEVLKGSGRLAVSQFTAPFVMLAHPLQTLKAGLSPLETLLRPSKLPLSAIETKWNTARIPIAMVGDEKTAMKLRDAATDSLIHGKTTEVELNGAKVKLSPAAVNRLGEPTMISASPDIRPFMDGAVIGKGKPVKLASGKSVIMGEARDMYVSPTFHSRFAEATSTGMQIKDAIPGGLIIRDQRIIQELEKSSKIYGGTAEIEAKLAASKKLELGKPVQTLVTRTPYGKKLVLLVYGKPFTAAEIAEMKMIGSLDTVKQIFSAPISVSKTSSAYTNLAGMVASREDLLQEIENLRRAGRTAELTRANGTLARLTASISRDYARLQGEYRKIGLPMRTVMVKTTRSAREVPMRDINRLLRNYQPVTKEGIRTLPIAERRALAEARQRINPRISTRGTPRETARTPVRETVRAVVRETPRETVRTPVRASPREALREVPRVPPVIPERIPPRTPTRVPPPTGLRPPILPPRIIPPVKPPRPPVGPPKPPVPPRAPILHKGKGDQKKEWTPEEISAAVAFRMGSLGRKGAQKPVTVAIRPPYGPTDKKVFVGETPEGMNVAANMLSAKKSIQLLRKGRVPDVIENRQGFARYSIARLTKPGVAEPGKITFTSGTNRAPVTLRSTLKGKVYHTETSGGVLLSRRPLGRHRKG